MIQIKLMNRQLIITVLIIAFILIATTAIVLYGMGYRFNLDDKGKPELAGTGLLVATSIPDGAQVLINGHLTTATDNTINLSPGEYSVKIFKEGYFPWEKKIKIQKEIVSKAEALLFPTAPKLDSITGSGATSPVIDPSMTKLVYTLASQSARKNGVYILDMSDRPILTLQSASNQIADDTVDRFSEAKLSWSPDGKELRATIINKNTETTYLLQANSFNQNPRDVTATLQTVLTVWDQDKKERDLSRMNTLKPLLRSVISVHFKLISWSPDDSKILYQASQSAAIPLVIKPRIIGYDSTPEERSIKKENIYVYDIKEDKNYYIDIDQNFISPVPITWFPDSKHFIYVHDQKVDIMDYDGTNRTTVYAGPFLDNYVFPWTNISKIAILTDLGNKKITPNLYTIGLK